jgi:hypothetical protein
MYVGDEREGRIVAEFYSGFDLAASIIDPETLQDAIKIKAFIRRVMTSSSCVRSAVCRLRGLQARLFEEWVYVSVNLRPLLALWRFDTMRGEEREIADSYRAEVHPQEAMIATLAHTTDLTSSEVALIRRRDVPDDGSSVSFRDQVYEIPNSLRAFVRCYMERRDKLVGDRDLDTFLVTAKGRTSVGPKWAASIAAGIRLEAPVGFVKQAPGKSDEPLFFRYIDVHQLEKYVHRENALAAL